MVAVPVSSAQDILIPGDESGESCQSADGSQYDHRNDTFLRRWAPGGSWPPSSTKVPRGPLLGALVASHLQLRQALGDVDVQVLDVDVDLLRGFQSGRSLAR